MGRHEVIAYHTVCGGTCWPMGGTTRAFRIQVSGVEFLPLLHQIRAEPLVIVELLIAHGHSKERGMISVGLKDAAKLVIDERFARRVFDLPGCGIGRRTGQHRNFHL